MHKPSPSSLAEHWDLDPEVVFLNHGSFGACPRVVMERQQELRARMEAQPLQFLYREGEAFVLMNTETFEQRHVQPEVIGDDAQWIQEGDEIGIEEYDGEIIGVEVATTVVLEVSHTEPGLAGDTATNTLKPATLETGVEVQVPLFIDIGEKIKVDTRSGEYVSRA